MGQLVVVLIVKPKEGILGWLGDAAVSGRPLNSCWYVMTDDLCVSSSREDKHFS